MFSWATMAVKGNKGSKRSLTPLHITVITVALALILCLSSFHGPSLLHTSLTLSASAQPAFQLQSIAASLSFLLHKGRDRQLELDLEKALATSTPGELAGQLWLYQQMVCAVKVVTGNVPKVQKSTKLAKLATTKAGFSMFVYPDADIVSSSVADPKQGSWEQAELDNIKYALAAEVHYLHSSTPPLFVDVGANIGWFTLHAANMGARVYSFEGLEDNISLLRASLCANPRLASRVTLFPLGLSHTNDTCFVVAAEANLGDGFTKCGVKTVADAQAAFQQGYTVRSRMLVRRLDDLLQEDIKVMKMDVEGWEYNILQGATQLLHKHSVPFLLVEANRGIIGMDGAYRLLDLLVETGYNVSNFGFQGPWIKQTSVKARGVNLEGMNLFAVHYQVHRG